MQHTWAIYQIFKIENNGLLSNDTYEAVLNFFDDLLKILQVMVKCWF